MCPCELSSEYVCDSCTSSIADRYRELRRLEAIGEGLTTDGMSVAEWDRMRELRGLLHRAGLKANIVIYRLTNGERQHA